ncbi:MAG: nickel-dependent hydrogenase large subunit, partial [Candidatus Desulforudaceae bacterium]
MARVTFPFGPQHPVLPEAIQFQLTCEDEKVVEVLPVIGYMHRGIEKAAEKNPFPDNVFLCERVCGICSFIHGATYCQVIEKMMDIQIPPRAEYLRVL